MAKKIMVAFALAITIGIGRNAGANLTLPYDGVCDTSDPAFSVTNNGSGHAIVGSCSSSNAIGSSNSAAVYGEATNTNQNEMNYGGYFIAKGGYGSGVYGGATGNTGRGVFGEAVGTNGVGVYGNSTLGDGVTGKTNAMNKAGVYGSSTVGKGISGETTSDNPWVSAVYGLNEGAGDGVYGKSINRHGTFGVTESSNLDHAGLYGLNHGAGSGVYGEATGANGKGVLGKGSVGVCGVGSTGVHAESTGGTALWAIVSTGYGDAIYGVSGPDGGYAADLKGNVLIRSRSDGSPVIELGEGLDYAEGFNVSFREEIDPGSVLIIDSDNPGKLALSTKAYDRKVAGIVAGAKGQDSAIRLGAGQFDYDVALAGRVYCNVDATDMSIEPGDLLTTSARPGYAMKVGDYVKAQGAVLGKAMERLEKGKKGQILVLVTLQ